MSVHSCKAISDHACRKFSIEPSAKVLLDAVKAFEHTEENLKKVFQIVEKMDKQDAGLPEVKEETVARPSRKREKLKMLMRERLREPGVSDLLREAQELYRTFTLGERQGLPCKGSR